MKRRNDAAKLEAEQKAFDRVMSEPTPEAQNAAARSLLEFKLGWNAAMAYRDRQQQAQGA